MGKKLSEPETYGLEQGDIGPVMDVAATRGGGASFTLEVGYWGIMLMLTPGDVHRLIKQLADIVGEP